jgi:hypothetical protein
VLSIKVPRQERGEALTHPTRQGKACDPPLRYQMKCAFRGWNEEWLYLSYGAALQFYTEHSARL